MQILNKYFENLHLNELIKRIWKLSKAQFIRTQIIQNLQTFFEYHKILSEFRNSNTVLKKIYTHFKRQFYVNDMFKSNIYKFDFEIHMRTYWSLLEKNSLSLVDEVSKRIFMQILFIGVCG